MQPLYDRSTLKIGDLEVSLTELNERTPIEIHLCYEEDDDCIPDRHVNSSDCWCQPTLFFMADNGNQVWVHRRNGEPLPSSRSLALAVAYAIAGREEEDPEEDEPEDFNPEF